MAYENKMKKFNKSKKPFVPCSACKNAMACQKVGACIKGMK